MATRVGLLVNPIAGMGGPVALKGSDDREALERVGAEPVAPGRARAFVDALVGLDVQVAWTTCPAPMGADVLEAAGVPHDVVGTVSPPTTADDTRALAPELAERCDVLVVVGGDGTMADVHEAGVDVPVVGVPSGVKMHSGTFAQDPAAAARVLAASAAGRAEPVETAVQDVDEGAFRAGRIALRREGLLWTLDHRLRVPSKSDEPDDAAAKSALGHLLGEEVRSGRWILGPGSTTWEVKEAAGLDGTPLGVDLVEDGRLVRADADATACRDHAGPDTRILVTPIGGQGVVLGRGNQPISADVVRACGTGNVVVVATPAKLAGLDAVRFDTGDPSLDAAFGPYVRILAGPQHTVVKPVTAYRG